VRLGANSHALIGGHEVHASVAESPYETVPESFRRLISKESEAYQSEGRGHAVRVMIAMECALADIVGTSSHFSAKQHNSLTHRAPIFGAGPSAEPILQAE